jgi:Fe-S-cluster-containing dehydrogenase component
VLHNKDLCIGCGYCFYACPFGAPQFPQVGNFGTRGKMDKCTFCAGGPEETNSEAEFGKYGRNRIAEGKLPLCAEMCATKALLGGDGDQVSDIYRERVVARGFGSGAGLIQAADPDLARHQAGRPHRRPVRTSTAKRPVPGARGHETPSAPETLSAIVTASEICAQ